MFRFLLFTVILFSNVLFFFDSALAQASDKDCEEFKKEITSLLKIMDDLNNELRSYEKLFDEADAGWQKWKNSPNIKKVLQSSSYNEQFKGELLDAGANWQNARNKAKNLIDETRLSILATKDLIADLLNKLANCGKKEKKTAMKEKPSSNNFLVGNTGNFEVCAGVGYGFSFNGNLLGQNKTFTATDRAFDGVYGSWAQGENIFIKTDFKVSDCFGAGVQFDYTYGKNLEFNTDAIGNNPTTTNYEARYTGYSATPFIQFNPCGINKMAPYIDLGLRLDFSNSIDQNIVQTQTNNNVTTVTTQDATFKGAFTTGFDASLGVKYYMKKNWALIAELNFSNSNFIASTGTITSYTVNGADQMGTLNTSQKQTNYVKSYTVPNSGFNPNSPSEALKSSQPANSIGARVGVFITFGEYEKAYGKKH